MANHFNTNFAASAQQIIVSLVRLEALPLRDQSGRIIKWFGTVVDLHDWKEAQRALQMTQAELARVSRLTTMGELAASIAMRSISL